MQETTNIGLKTYEANDPTDWLGEFNYNMNKIDTAVGSQNDQIDVIEETASTAVSTANTASTTATNALNTANTKASIDDLVSSTTTTYSSDKIDDLISGIQPGTEIDDTTTSTTSTWSSSKINTEIDAVETIANSKASINDTTAGSSTTYSSNKSNNMYCKIPDYSNTTDITGTTSDMNTQAFYDFGSNLQEGWYKLYFGCSEKTDSSPTDYDFVDLTISKNISEVYKYWTEDVTKHWSTFHEPVIRYYSPLFYYKSGQISVRVKFSGKTSGVHKPSSMTCILTRIAPVE